MTNSEEMAAQAEFDSIEDTTLRYYHGHVYARHPAGNVIRVTVGELAHAEVEIAAGGRVSLATLGAAADAIPEAAGPIDRVLLPDNIVDMIDEWAKAVLEEEVEAA